RLKPWHRILKNSSADLCQPHSGGELKQTPPRKHFEEDGANRVNIDTLSAAEIPVATEMLLGSSILRGAREDVTAFFGKAGQPCYSKIKHDRLVVVFNENIGRLKVAMNNSTVVSALQSGANGSH